MPKLRIARTEAARDVVVDARHPRNNANVKSKKIVICSTLYKVGWFKRKSGEEAHTMSLSDNAGPAGCANTGMRKYRKEGKMSAESSSSCRKYTYRSAASGVAIAAVIAAFPAMAADGPEVTTQGNPHVLHFPMIRSAAAEAGKCLAGVHARVQIEPLGPVERMTIVATGVPENTEFDLFVVQIANAPFGLSWYQGDMESNARGVARGVFIGRFNIETFIVAPGTGPAPVVHDQPPNPDADTNPATPPVHTFHLGLWFNSPNDAVAAGCPNAVTPFNGDHNAGIQILSTRNFVKIGPLSQLRP